MYDYIEQNFSDISLTRETANWLEADGTLGRRGDVYLSSFAFLLGNEKVKYKFREPL